MLSPQEVALLHWCGAEHFSGQGVIVDAGCFLGGSTFAFGSGLAANPRLQAKAPLVHSYDRFIVHEDPEAYVSDLYPEVRNGESFRPVFEQAIAPIADWVVIHEGDITQTRWEDATPIEVLFIDIAKTPKTLEAVVHGFFHALIPGHSLVIQQDQNFPNWPWVAVCMEYFSDYFEWLDALPYATSVYRCRQSIPPEKLAGFCYAAIPENAKLALMDRALERVTGQAFSRLRLAKVTLLDHLGREADAQHLLAQIYREFDQEAFPYFPSHFGKYMEKAELLDFPKGFDDDRLTVIAQLAKEEALLLFSLVTALKPQRLLEIGRSRGGSAMLFASALRANGSGLLASLDPAIDPEHRMAPRLQQLLAPWVRFIDGFSPQDNAQASHAVGGKFDFVLIDGDHSYQACLRDLLGVLPFLEDSAVIILHDHFYPGVADAIDFALANHPELTDCGPLISKPFTLLSHIPYSDGRPSLYWGIRMLRYSASAKTPPNPKTNQHDDAQKLRAKIHKLETKVATLNARVARSSAKPKKPGFLKKLGNSIRKRFPSGGR